LLAAGAGNVIGHRHDPYVDALPSQSLGSEAEMEDIAGVIAEGQQQAAALLHGGANPLYLPGRG
jgi:hypothetical protein